MSGKGEHEGLRPERPEGREQSERPESVDVPDEPVLDEAERLLAARIAALPDVPAPQGWQAAVLAALPEDPPPRPRAARSDVTTDGANGTDAAPIAPGRPGGEGASGASTRAVSGQATPPPRRVRRWAMGASAAAAAMAAALAVWRGGKESNQLELDQPKLTIRSAGSTRTSPGSGRAALGDTLRVEVYAPADALLRLYRNEKEIVLECPSAAPQCLSHTRGLAAELTLSAPGSYRAVVLRPASKVPRSTGELDDDLAACRCETKISLPVVAQ